MEVLPRLFSLCVALVTLRRPCALACCSHSCPLPLALSQPPRLRCHASEALPCPASAPCLPPCAVSAPRCAPVPRVSALACCCERPAASEQRRASLHLRGHLLLSSRLGLLHLSCSAHAASSRSAGGASAERALLGAFELHWAAIGSRGVQRERWTSMRSFSRSERRSAAALGRQDRAATV